MKKHMILNVYVNKSTNILTGSEIQINSSIQCFPIPQEMIFQVTRIARPTSALSPCALSKPHCRGSREMHGSRRDVRLYARFAGAARYLHSSPELSRLSLRFREYSYQLTNYLPVWESALQKEKTIFCKSSLFWVRNPKAKNILSYVWDYNPIYTLTPIRDTHGRLFLFGTEKWANVSSWKAVFVFLMILASTTLNIMLQ